MKSQIVDFVKFNLLQITLHLIVAQDETYFIMNSFVQIDQYGIN